MMSLRFVFALLLTAQFLSCPFAFCSNQATVEEAPVSDAERAKVLKQMQGFAGSFQKMPQLPKMNATIILPEPKEDDLKNKGE